MKKLITILTALTILFSTAAMPVCADSANSVNTTEKSAKQEQVTLSTPVLESKTVGKSTIKLTWNAVEGADSYILYVLNPETNKFKKVIETKALACNHKGLKAERKYIYVVRAKAVIDGVTVYSKFSKRQTIYLGYKIGNTPGNLDNGGEVAYDGEWIYFNDSYKGNGLAKIRPDGTDYTKLSDDEGTCINVVGDYVYYINLVYSSKNKYTNYNIIRIKKDGTGRKILFSSVADKDRLDSTMVSFGYASSTWVSNLYDIYDIEQMIIIGNKIYFKIVIQEGGLSDLTNYLCMDTSGNNLTYYYTYIPELDNELPVREPDYWLIISNYLKDIPSSVMIYDELTCVESSSYKNKIIYIENDDIYYYDNGFKMKSLDDNKTIVLCDKKDFITSYSDVPPYYVRMNYYNGWVYFKKLNSVFNVYKVRLDGTQLTQVSNKALDARDPKFYTAGDWIVYISNGEYYKVHTDGTDEQLLVPEEKKNK